MFTCKVVYMQVCLHPSLFTSKFVYIQVCLYPIGLHPSLLTFKFVWINVCLRPSLFTSNCLFISKFLYVYINVCLHQRLSEKKVCLHPSMYPNHNLDCVKCFQWLISKFVWRYLMYSVQLQFIYIHISMVQDNERRTLENGIRVCIKNKN